MIAALAAVAAAAAWLLWWPKTGQLARLQPARARHRWPHGSAVAYAGVVLGAAVGGGLFDGAAGAALGLCAGAVGVTVVGLWRRHRQDRVRRRLFEDVVDACQLLAGLLRVGHVPVLALRLAATDAPVLVEAAAAHQVGASVPATLRRLASRPGGDGLADLASAWEVSERTGASLTATLDALAERLEAARKVARTVEAELAAPRATGRLLAALPLVGLSLGYLIGGDPAHFLLGSVVGQLCLVAGVLLACGGVWWIEALATVRR